MMELQSRMDLPALFSKMNFGIGAEVGVFRGDFAAHILRNWDGFLFAVDSWVGRDDDHFRTVVALRNATAGSDRRRWRILREASLEAARQLQEEKQLLDFVYIDANHSYEAVKTDILAWWPLIRSGGMLAGHDWVLDGWHVDGEPFVAHESRPREHWCWEYGVRKAVAELREPGGILHGLEMRLTPSENDGGWQSFLFQKPEEK